MKIRLTVEVEVEHVSGVFVTKDEIAEEIGLWIEGADEGIVYVGDSEYETTEWAISHEGEALT